MKGRLILSLALLLGLTKTTNACIDFGVEVKSGGEYDALNVRATGKAVTMKGGDGTIYNFHYDGNSKKGKWCFNIYKGKKSYEGCTGDKKGMATLRKSGLLVSEGLHTEIRVNDATGHMSTIIRLQNDPNKLSGTEFTGSFLTLVHAKQGKEGIAYSGPMLRFAYQPSMRPLSVDTNDRQELEKQLKAAGVDPQKAMRDYSITHSIYADLFSKKDAGILDGPPQISGTLHLEKKEIPFSPIPKAVGGEKTGTADLSKGHFRGVKDAVGCTSEVQQFGDAAGTPAAGKH